VGLSVDVTDSAAIDAVAAFLEEATSPALVVGAGADDPDTWSALVELAERLVVPVFQETFGARAGFPQDHPLYRGTLPADTDLVPLYGDLAAAEQDRAIRPSPPGRRKVVLATSIAETSLTIDGVRIVIDAGWMRVPRFSPRTGMERLETVRVTQASADQRRGRAGRLEPGGSQNRRDAVSLSLPHLQ